MSARKSTGYKVIAFDLKVTEQPVKFNARCQLCGAVFASASHYQMHIMLDHIKQDRRPPLPLRISRNGTGKMPYSCGVCRKAFPRLDSLLYHMQSHPLSSDCTPFTINMKNYFDESEVFIPRSRLRRNNSTDKESTACLETVESSSKLLEVAQKQSIDKQIKMKDQDDSNYFDESEVFKPRSRLGRTNSSDKESTKCLETVVSCSKLLEVTQKQSIDKQIKIKDQDYSNYYESEVFKSGSGLRRTNSSDKESRSCVETVVSSSKVPEIPQKQSTDKQIEVKDPVNSNCFNHSGPSSKVDSSCDNGVVANGNALEINIVDENENAVCTNDVSEYHTPSDIDTQSILEPECVISLSSDDLSIINDRPLVISDVCSVLPSIDPIDTCLVDEETSASTSNIPIEEVYNQFPSSVSERISVRSTGCRFCNKRFSNTSRLRAHEKLSHTDTGIACSVCGKSFASKFYLERHFASHLADKPFPCSICSRAFTRKDKMKEHKQRMHNMNIIKPRINKRSL